MLLLQHGTCSVPAGLDVAPSKTPKEREAYDKVKVLTNEIFYQSDIIFGITGLYLDAGLSAAAIPGMIEAPWRQGLLALDALDGIDWP